MLARAFVVLDHEFAAVSEGSYVGTTAVVVLLSSQRIWVAHCGEESWFFFWGGGGGDGAFFGGAWFTGAGWKTGRFATR